MGKGKAKAHQLALKWWETHHSSAQCDICGAEVHRGEGYLCAHFSQGPILPGTGMLLDLGGGSPDLLCGSCFDEFPTARPARNNNKRWWQFWK